MGKDPQLRLFRRRRKPPPPEEPGLGHHPARLAFGEPESLAFKRAREEELDRRRREQAERRRREHLSEAQRRVWQQRQDGYPAAEQVVEALREEIEEDEGLPRKRARIEARTAERLTARYSYVPRQYVQEVLSRALQSGLVSYRNRRWTWEGTDEVEPSAAETRSLTRLAASFGVVLRTRGEVVPVGAGTLVSLGDAPGLITTTSVWGVLTELGDTLEVHTGRRSLIELDLDLVEPFSLGEGLPLRSGWGPDLCVLRLPGMLRRAFEEKDKGLFELNPATDLLGAERALLVTPNVFQADPELERVEMVGRHTEGVEGMEVDYLEIAGVTNGWLSGTAVFSTRFEAQGGWAGTVELEGVLFAVTGDQQARGHGLRSVEEVVESATPAGEAQPGWDGAED